LTLKPYGKIVNQVVKSSATLSAVFGALADPTERHILTCHSSGYGQALSELARPHAMSQPGFRSNLGVFEDSRPDRRAERSRVVRCSLSPSLP
jgi:hypothetical protein